MSIEVVTPNGVKRVERVEVTQSLLNIDGQAMATIEPPNINICYYTAYPFLGQRNGVYIESCYINNNMANIALSEMQAGFEGINFKFPNLKIGSNYLINFNIQFLEDQCWWMGGNNPYVAGYKLSPTDIPNYTDFGTWPNNIDRDYYIHNHQLTFTASQDIMYLSFNICALSDAYVNYFNITDFYVKEITE